MKKVVLGAVVALALVAAGCGGSSSKTLSADEYSSQLNTICADYNAAQKKIGDPQSLEDVGTLGPQIVDEFNKAIAKAKDLKPPAELESAANEFISLAGQQVDLINQLIDAAKAGDAAKANELGTQIDPITTKSDDLAKNELNAPACAQ
jgi:outer membrane murein-binding lipoprotein Lpp